MRTAFDKGPWSLSMQSIERRLDQMPEPLAKLAPYPVAFAIKADVARRAGALTGSATWNATWQGALPDARCAIEILPRARGTVELRDEDGEEMRGALHLLGRRHLVLLASLRETVLEEALDAPVQSLPDALRVGAIHDYLAARRRAHRDLAARGVNLLDVRPSELPIALVNRYLDIKAAGAL